MPRRKKGSSSNHSKVPASTSQRPSRQSTPPPPPSNSRDNKIGSLSALKKSLVEEDTRQDKEDAQKSADALQSIMEQMKNSKKKRKVDERAQEETVVEVSNEEETERKEGPTTLSLNLRSENVSGDEDEDENENVAGPSTSGRFEDEEESEDEGEGYEDNFFTEDFSSDDDEERFGDEDEDEDEHESEREAKGPMSKKQKIEKQKGKEKEKDNGKGKDKGKGKEKLKRKADRDKEDSENEDGTGEGEEKKKFEKKPLGDLPPGFKIYPTQIKNKQKRIELYKKVKAEKQKIKRIERKKRQKERQALGDKAPPVPEPRTIENTREFDETFVKPDDEEVFRDEAIDEFADHFINTKDPKILFTTSKQSTPIAFEFIEDLLRVFPNSTFRKRGRYELKEIIEYAKNQDYTNLIVINENAKKINGALFIHLPDGPTAHFRISSVKLMKEIKGAAPPNQQKAQLILNNFNTRLGHTIGRFFASLLSLKPHGKRVITFHNQRDFIFFRHHTYVFDKLEDGSKKARLQEIGPRFTLRLKSLQRGTFNSQFGQYEWIFKKKMETSRRRFFL
jgi:ribosome production factor 1